MAPLVEGDALIKRCDALFVYKNIIQTIFEGLLGGGDGLLRIYHLGLLILAARIDLPSFRSLLKLLWRQHPNESALLLALVKLSNFVDDDGGDEGVQQRLPVGINGQGQAGLPGRKEGLPLAKHPASTATVSWVSNITFSSMVSCREAAHYPSILCQSTRRGKGAKNLQR